MSMINETFFHEEATHGSYDTQSIDNVTKRKYIGSGISFSGIYKILPSSKMILCDYLYEGKLTLEESNTHNKFLLTGNNVKLFYNPNDISINEMEQLKDHGISDHYFCPAVFFTLEVFAEEKASHVYTISTDRENLIRSLSRNYSGNDGVEIKNALSVDEARKYMPEITKRLSEKVNNTLLPLVLRKHSNSVKKYLNELYDLEEQFNCPSEYETCFDNPSDIYIDIDRCCH